MGNILIVGANTGIGYYMAKTFLESGNRVAVLDICTEKIEKLKPLFPKTLFTVVADAASTEEINAGVGQAMAQWGAIHIAIFNACICTFESEPDTDIEVYKKVFEVNYFGALRLAKALLPGMREAGKGHLVFTSSGVGVTGFYNISPYASTKGALESLAKCLQIENEPYGISVHVAHPPLTDTASAGGIKIPKEFKASAEKVGKGLAKKMEWLNPRAFLLCHSLGQTLQMRFSYRHPLFIGRMMTKMTKRAENQR